MQAALLRLPGAPPAAAHTYASSTCEVLITTQCVAFGVLAKAGVGSWRLMNASEGASTNASPRVATDSIRTTRAVRTLKRASPSGASTMELACAVPLSPESGYAAAEDASSANNDDRIHRFLSFVTELCCRERHDET